MLVFGDLAGRSILEYLDKGLGRAITPSHPEEYPDTPCDTVAERGELADLLESALGVIKCESDMLRAKKRIDKIIEGCTQGGRSYDRIRLRNDAVVARAVLIAALERRESVGAHIRSDAIPPCGEKYRIILQNKNGDIAVKREAIK